MVSPTNKAIVSNLRGYVSRIMRYKVTKQHSTKAERIVYEILKELHIDFKHRWIVGGCEVDFIIGKYAIEIDGHPQDGYKNEHLVRNGYIPLHMTNKEVMDRHSTLTLMQKICEEIQTVDL